MGLEDNKNKFFVNDIKFLINKYLKIINTLVTNEEKKIYELYSPRNFLSANCNVKSDDLIFTHNNTCNNLVRKLSNQFCNVPTTGVLIFEFNVSLWRDISNCNLSHYFPKDFR